MTINSLGRDISWSFAGNVTYAACQWGMLIALAKLCTATDVGHFALGLAVSAPVLMFLNMQLRVVQATDSRHRFNPSHYVAARIASTSLSFAIISAILIGSHTSEVGVVITLVVGIAKCVEAISDILYGLLQKHQQFRLIASSLILKGASSLTGWVIILALTHSLLAAVCWIATCWTLVLFFFDIPAARGVAKAKYGTGSLTPRWDWRVLLTLSHLAYPLGLVMLLISLNANIPRYIVERVCGTHGLGVFSALVYVLVAGQTLMSSVGQSLTPRLARHYADGGKSSFTGLINRAELWAVALGSAGAFCAWSFGPEILKLFYGVKYAEANIAFLLMMLGGILVYPASIVGVGLTAAKAFRPQTALLGLTSVATIVLSTLLIPRYQLNGAAAAMSLVAVVHYLGSRVLLSVALRKFGRSSDPI